MSSSIITAYMVIFGMLGEDSEQVLKILTSIQKYLEECTLIEKYDRAGEKGPSVL